MRRRIALVILLSSLASARGGHAAEGRPDAVVALTIEQALVRAEERSPLVRRALGERRVTEARRVGAAIALPSNPLLAASVGHRADSSGSVPLAQGVEWGLHLEQSFEIGGQRGARMAEVDRAVDVSSARLRLARVETRARVRSAYVAALLGHAQVQAALQSEQLAEQVLGSARTRAGAGATSDVELNLALVEHGRAAHERAEADLAAAGAESELLLLLGFGPETSLALTTPLGEPKLPERSVARMIEAAKARREELRALDATRSELDATLIRLRKEIVPNPTVFADLARQTPRQTYLGGGIGIALPVFRRNQGELSVVAAERAWTEDERRLWEHEMAIEVARTARSLAAHRSEVGIWRDTVVPAADAALDLVTRGWQAGKFDVFRVIQAAREAAIARRKQIEVTGMLWFDAIELDRVTGEP
jgi:outer membrane protein, heavy metal efflux system